jgi:hypothetical protein
MKCGRFNRLFSATKDDYSYTHKALPGGKLVQVFAAAALNDSLRSCLLLLYWIENYLGPTTILTPSSLAALHKGPNFLSCK